jgi:SPP1 family predicted phage head-tail adaptor
MRIGDLKNRIQLEAPVAASDNMGGSTDTFTTMATIWAAIWPVSASEQIEGMGATMTITHRIRIRYREDVIPSWRINFKGKYYNIVSIINPGMNNRMIEILAKESV